MKNVFQIFLCDSEHLTYNLTNCSHVFDRKKQNILEHFQEYTYKLYLEEELQELLFSFDKEIFDCFNKIKPYAYKCDLARLCLLYKYGGWYFDLVTEPQFYFNTRNKELWFYNSKRKMIENFILYSLPNSNFYEKLIRELSRRIKINWYGKNPLDITGPSMITDQFYQYDKNLIKQNFTFGKFYNGSPAQIILENKTFAIHKKPQYFGTIEYMGFKGTNNYNQMWTSKQVY